MTIPTTYFRPVSSVITSVQIILFACVCWNAVICSNTISIGPVNCVRLRALIRFIREIISLFLIPLCSSRLSRTGHLPLEKRDWIWI